MDSAKKVYEGFVSVSSDDHGYPREVWIDHEQNLAEEIESTFLREGALDQVRLRITVEQIT